MSLTMSAASRLAWFSIAATSSALACVGGEAGDALEFAFPFRVFLVELGGAVLQVLLARGQGLGALLDPLELLVQPLLAIGEAQFAALEVTAQLADLVLDRADLFFDFPAALGGLFGLGAGSFEDAGGFGLGAGADVLGFLAGLFQLDGVLGWVELRALPWSGARRRPARTPPRATRSP